MSCQIKNRDVRLNCRTQSIRITTQLQLSNHCHGCELPSPIFTVHYKNQPLGRIISDGALFTSNDGRMNAVNSSFAITSVSSLHTMGQDLAQLPNISWEMSAWSSAEVPMFNVPSLKFPIPYVYISKTVSIEACHGLPNIHLELFDLYDVPGPGKVVKLHITVKFLNPAVFVLDFSHVKFNVFFQDFYNRLS